jgi:hypothetical protein
MNRYVALLIVLMSIPLAAQQPPKAPASPQAPATPAAPSPPVPPVDPEQGGQPINIRLDVSVTDEGGTGAAQPKTLMVMLVDRAMGRTRAAFEDRSIAVDARPTLVDGRIRVYITVLSENPPLFSGPPKDHTINWRNSFSLLLDNGKPMLAMETSDAVTKRKMSIEVKATIQK